MLPHVYLSMQKARFKWISIIIAVSIVITVLTQGYWNYRNFQLNEQRFLNDMQVALDNGVESYYANLAKFEMVDMARFNRDTLPGAFSYNFSFDNENEDTLILDYSSFSTIDTIKKGHIFTSVTASSSGTQEFVHRGNGAVNFRRIITRDSILADTLPTHFTDLASKIVIALTRDSIDEQSLFQHISDELERKSLPQQVKLLHLESCCPDLKRPLKTANILLANPAFLPPGIVLEMGFGNYTWKILQMGLVSMLLSIAMAAMIIWGLLYLYNVIKNQRQLAELKNDLINNLTHEFKTPIATISTALEGIDKFNETNDLEKTRKYIGIGQDQLKKLDQMVEKLLETATLEKDEIILNKESVDLSALLQKMLDKYEMTGDKHFEADIAKEVITRVDRVHIDNAISNLIDNAVKYGGDSIQVKLKASQHLELEVSDNGPGIEKRHQDKIFEKFYRIPKGDQHDVKGYGIGLYYTQKIIEKHGGQISLNSKPGKTTFKITLP
ncbi:MAG: HAMP domain-containing sensor histidine kinase [Cytophagales bacterium]|nr:HAMP domain-containing sensor histidine kinase [Cytophagales bacterium]